LDLSEHQAGRVKIVFYTDPLCCWSWAFQPHWQRFTEAFNDRISYTYCMAGMIPDWNKYNDPFTAVSRPAQMGPIWMEARHLTGAEINDMVWAENPPSSSYPACIAVKTAALQGFEASEIYLRAVSKAVMVNAQDISQKDVLLEIARAASLDRPKAFDSDRFAEEYNSNASRDAFRDDLRQVSYHKIGRFPTLTFTRGGKGLIMTGYRPYEALVEAFRQIDTASEPAGNVV